MTEARSREHTPDAQQKISMDTPNLPQPVTQTDSKELVFVAEVLDRCLREPLAALRATLDAFARHHVGDGDGRDGSSIANAALERVVELGRTVQDLHDFAAPPPLHPMRCSIDEIVHDALDEFGPEQRPSIMTALDEPRARLFVDGPVLSRCLAHLIAEGLRGEGECLLHARRRGEGMQFVIVQTLPANSRTAENTGDRTGSLGLINARRDLDRMNGRITLHTSEGTSTTTVDGLAGLEPREAAA